MSLVAAIPANTEPQLRSLLLAMIAKLDKTPTETQVQVGSVNTVTDPNVIAKAVPPTQPVGLTVVSGYTTISLSWSTPLYAGHSYTEIYRSKLNSSTDAVANGLYAYTRANAFNDSVAPGSGWYYFIRFVNVKLEVGPFASIYGESVVTSISLTNVAPGTMAVDTLTPAKFSNGTTTISLDGETLTAPNVVSNKAAIGTYLLAISATPVDVGELAIEATSNTSLTLKYKGSDGVVRSAVITLV